MNTEQVILVDEHDAPLGVMEKMEAHRSGTLHRALSVFIFNSKGEWLLQKRAAGKYHSGGLWTNACCSHPRPGESTDVAAHRRLKEEMGIECDLKFLFAFQYRAEVGNGLTEHELDHVFVGRADELPDINPEEVSGWNYFSPEFVQREIQLHPQNYTTWFRLIFERVRSGQ